jgi:uncharacterized membrane protein
MLCFLAVVFILFSVPIACSSFDSLSLSHYSHFLRAFEMFLSLSLFAFLHTILEPITALLSFALLFDQ